MFGTIICGLIAAASLFGMSNDIAFRRGGFYYPRTRAWHVLVPILVSVLTWLLAYWLAPVWFVWYWSALCVVSLVIVGYDVWRTTNAGRLAA